MSLVDYASSSEEEEVRENDNLQPYKQDGRDDDRTVEIELPADSDAAKSRSSQSTYLFHPNVVIPCSAPSMEKLPDASILLSSPSFSPQQYGGADRSSRVASTIGGMASRKREPNGLAFIHPPNKHPRGNLTHARNIPGTISDTFVPPQLKGRSNVVTEDLRKLFVKRQ